MEIFALTLLTVLTTFSGAAVATEPELTIQMGDQRKAFTRSELLASNKLEKVVVPQDPSYPGKTMTYQAIQARRLFSDFSVDENAVIQFKSTDGFSAPLSKERLLNRSGDQAIAYVAIEPAKSPWPALKSGHSRTILFNMEEPGTVGHWPRRMALYVGGF